MIRILAWSFGLACLAPPALAQQPDSAAFREACTKDVATLCPGTQPEGGRIAACFKENRAKLSEKCLTALQKADTQL